MSPPTRPHLPDPNSLADHVESSNSTASIFLGGVRRNWMLDASSNPTTSTSTTASYSPRSRNQHLHSPTAPPPVASSSATTNNACPPQGMRNPPPSRPPRSRPSAERVPLHRFQAGPPTVSVPALPQNAVRELQKGVSTATGEASLMSPVTPGATLQHHDATSSGPPAHANLPNTTTISIDESHRANIAQQPASLPSPDPSTSHTSPTSIVEGNGDHPLHAVLPSPTIRTVQTQPQSRISPLTQQTALPRPDSRGLNSPHHGEGQTTNGANHPTPPDAARPVANQAPDAINDTFWAFLTNKLDTFVARSNGEMALSETIELPRIRLLRDACHGQDLLYLALHQIYCLATFAPSELARLPGFGPQHSPGLEVVKQLLVDNSRLSGDFLKWAVHFPLPLKQMLQVPLYSAAVKQASQCLVFLSERWGPFEAQVRLRAWPPLIDELVVQFGITSSVLLSIVFLAMCRRLHGPQHEMRLRSLFHQNKRNYDRRFDKSQVVTNDQMQRENDILIKNFRALNTIPVQVAQTPSPSMAPMPPTAVSALNNGGQTMQQPIHRQPPGPIPNPRPPHMSAYVANRLPSNAQAVYPNQPSPTSWQHPHLQHMTQPPIPVRMTVSPTINVNPPPAPSQSPNQQAQALPTRVTLRPTELNLNQQNIPPNHMYPTYVQGPWPQSPSHPQAHPQVQPHARPGSQHQSQPQPQPQPQAQAHPHPRNRPMAYTRFLPPAGWLPPNAARPNALRLAIHQAHLRDPLQKLLCQEPTAGEEPELFQYLSSFILPPTFLGRDQCAFNWQFTLSSSDCARFPRTHPNAIGQRATRVLAEGCRTYRLRCIKVSPSAKTVEQEAWSTADAVWPSVIYIFVNNSELYVRRKVHNGKDLPLDITDYLCEGTNNISMHFIRSMVETKDLVYALGVEVMDVSGFTQVKELARTVSASETRDRIQKRLNSSAADDELSIVNDDLTINLVDPFMARIFNIPARGGSCIHEECFDLETFLKTRASKSGKGPMKDNWKCPICAEDARPQRLIIDGFLVEVRAELERTNQLEDAQTILIKANGSWELKSGKDAHDKEGENERISGSSLKRKRSGQGSGFSPAPQRPKTEGPAETSLCRNSRLSEVIELD